MGLTDCTLRRFFVLGTLLRQRALGSVPLRLFRVRNVLLSSFYNFFGVCSCFSVQFYVPIYLQVMGLSTVQNSLRFVPQAAAAAVTLLAVGFIVKITGRY